VKIVTLVLALVLSGCTIVIGADNEVIGAEWPVSEKPQ
jgi:hypothetical protein